MAAIEEDSSLAEDMMNVEVLLGHNVVRMVKDNLILDLLRTYSTDTNRVQKVVNELQQNYLPEFSLLMDEEDDDVLLALDSPYLNTWGSHTGDPTPNAQKSTFISSGSHTTPLVEDVSSSSNSPSNKPESKMREPVLQPAKFNVSDSSHNPNTNERPRESIPSVSSSRADPKIDSFVNHRNVVPGRVSDESYNTSTESESEPEFISIHEEDRKRKKLHGNKSPEKKSKVEVVDLVTSSPNSALNSEYFDILQSMFPDADPEYLRQKFKRIENEQELNIVAAEMLEANNYPRTVIEGPKDVELDRPSTSSNHTSASVILRPSVLEVQHKPQPSSSSTVTRKYEDWKDHPKDLDEVEPLLNHLNPDETAQLMAAISSIESDLTYTTLPQSSGTVSNLPPAVLQPDWSPNQELVPTTMPKASLPSPAEVRLSTLTPAGNSGVSSTQTTPVLSEQAGPILNTQSQSNKTSPPAISALPCETIEISPPETPASSFPAHKEIVHPSIVSEETVPVSRDLNEPGPSGLNNIKEEPWAEKYSLLLCLFPESNPKYLEDKARQLHNKAEELELFVETSLDALHNRPPTVDRTVMTQVKQVEPAVPVSTYIPRSTVPNAPKTFAGNALTGSSTSIPKPLSITSGGTNADLPGPSNAKLPGPSNAKLPGPSNANLPGPSNADLPGPSGLSTSDGDTNPWSQKHSFLLSILPDADPSFLEEKAKLLFDKEEELKTFVANALENKDYPTLKDYQRRQELVELQNKYLKDFNIENFLEIVPEPFKYFSQTNRKPSADTQNRGLLFLKRKYRLIRSNDISAIYKKHLYNLTNTCHDLNNFKGVPLKSRRPDFQIGDKLPDTTLSLQFLQEVAFIENEDKIKKYLKDKEDEEERALKEAREKGELLECNCCFDDEVLARNIVTCPDGHLFCRNCVRKGAETKIGEGTTKVSCLTDCPAEFTLQSLQGVLKPTVFSKLAQRKQLEEIKAAGIEDLVQCPFCDFCNIPGTGDKVFRCLNPDCMKNSCILCKEESHIPLRCNEVEKASEVKMRTYIEDKMTEALVRTCWKCQRKFVKIDGCNKMTCQCGALMCYICRQPVSNYSHFNGQGGEEYNKCPLFSDNNALHVDAVEKVAAEAKAELAQKHPGLTLLHDPTAVPIRREAGGRPRVPHIPLQALARVAAGYAPVRYPMPVPAAAGAPAAAAAGAPPPLHAPNYPHMAVAHIQGYVAGNPPPAVNRAREALPAYLHQHHAHQGPVQAPARGGDMPNLDNFDEFAADFIANVERHQRRHLERHTEREREIERQRRERQRERQRERMHQEMLRRFREENAAYIHANLHRQLYAHVPYNVNVPQDGNAYNAQDVRPHRQFHHPPS